jgi:hypothetical protein
MRPRTLIALLTLATIAMLPREAHADFDFQLSMGMSTRWVRKTPALSTDALTTDTRDFPAGDVPMRGGMLMLGGYIDAAVTLDDRWVVPLLGGGYYHALGSFDAVITSRDGSIVRAQPWSGEGLDILLPGVGYRAKKRRWMFGATLRMGVGFIAMDALLADGAVYAPMEMRRATFLFQAELEACRRLDPTTRMCLQVAPRIFDHELLNGVLFGLRAEWGR